MSRIQATKLRRYVSRWGLFLRARFERKVDTFARLMEGIERRQYGGRHPISIATARLYGARHPISVARLMRFFF